MHLGRRALAVDLDDVGASDEQVVLGLDLVVDAAGRLAVVAEKVARTDGPGRWRSPFLTTEVVGRHALARCLADVHPAPDDDCDCGFHGVTDRWHLRSGLQRELAGGDVGSGLVVLAVALSGRVVVHEHGLRARHQAVLASTPVRDWIADTGAGDRRDPDVSRWDVSRWDAAGWDGSPGPGWPPPSRVPRAGPRPTPPTSGRSRPSGVEAPGATPGHLREWEGRPRWRS